jgi:hypothetical protein
MRTCLRTRDISNLLITTDRSNYCANVVLLRSSISNVIATKTQPFVVPGRIPVDPTTLASYFRTLKRQRVVRNRSNGNPTTQSKRADRLLVLPELSREQDGSPSSLFSISSSSSVPSSSTPFCSTGPKAKRLSNLVATARRSWAHLPSPTTFLAPHHALRRSLHRHLLHLCRHPPSRCVKL